MNECMNLDSNQNIVQSSGDSFHDDDNDDEEENEVFRNMRQQELKSIETDILNWIESNNTIDIKSEFERTRDPLSGASILHVCAAKGYNEILNKLLSAFKSQIDLDSFRDCDGFTALHAAAFWKQPETFETLLKFGANPELLTEKTSENIISSSVLELCKNDPKFIQMIEINKEKEKIAKESETQRKIFAKRQREIRRSTQGVKKEDLEKALKMMESSEYNLFIYFYFQLNFLLFVLAKNPSESSEKDFNSIMMKVNSIESNDTSSTQIKSPESDTTCWTIKLPPKSSTTNSESENNKSDNSDLTKKATNDETIHSDTPPTVTMTISSTTPAEFARKRRIKRRSTGIEDDSGHALSPDSIPDTTHPLASATENVDAAFEVILSVCIFTIQLLLSDCILQFVCLFYYFLFAVRQI